MITDQTTKQQPWVTTLRTLMTARRLNPRSLSLKAGLNATAVRDVLEGRVKFPRYDTVMKLSEALGVTPSKLMHASTNDYTSPEEKISDSHIELLTEIITHLQEAIEENDHRMEPRDFAAMVTTFYHRARSDETVELRSSLGHNIRNLVSYEALRSKQRRTE